MELESKSLIHITNDNTEIYVIRGKKSLNDFIVKYKQPGKRIRTPKHIHLLIDLLLKKSFQRELTLKFVKKLFDTLENIIPLKSFPPEF